MLEKVEKRNISQRMTALKMKAAIKYNVTAEQCHVGHVLLEAMREDPLLVHQIDANTGESQTNLEVATRSVQLAAAMRAAGLQLGDGVVVMAKNHLGVAAPYYASHYNGYALCTMDTDHMQKDIVQLFSTIKPRIVFCPKDKEEIVSAGISLNELKCSVVTFDGEFNVDAFIQKYNGTEKDFRPAIFDQSKTIAWLMLTSGTTGLPKVNIVPFATLEAVLHFTWATPTVRLPAMLVLSSVQWLSTHLAYSSSPLVRSTRVQTSRDITPAHLRDIINQYRPNLTVITPCLIRKLLIEEGQTCDLSCFWVIYIAGGVPSTELLNQVKAKIPGLVFNAYGMTELLVSVFEYIPGATPGISVGRPRAGAFKYKLVDENDNEIYEPNQVGELWVKGDMFGKGYLNNREETAKLLSPDGWVRTGDLFSRDENHFYYFKERRRLLLNVQKQIKISPIEIEEVIRQHAGVGEVCVVGVLQPELYQLPVAAVLPRPGAILRPADIFNLVKKSLPELKHLHGGLFFVESFPMTPSGKVNRAKVAELAAAAELIVPN